MPKIINYSALNASTVDIMNVIRQQGSTQYQNEVPEVTKASDIPVVGKVIYGDAALRNQFVNALVNRIARVVIQSATFNDPYRDLKKGQIQFGESIEEIFVEMAKPYEYSAEKGAQREFKRTPPKAHSAFHVMNWQVTYPITIQNRDLYQAFLTENGVTDLIARIVDQVYTGAEYDEFLLFKYLIIKGVSHGKFYPIKVGDGTNLDEAAAAFRGTSNLLPFMKSDFNESHVITNTPKERQSIFMDANFNAKFDVNVLAAAFHMEKADFMGKLHLIDDFTTFDNDRFDEIRANSTQIEEVTPAELNLMKDVVAVLVDDNWFQVYDYLDEMTETFVASGLYWNYFYHVRKGVSYSPYSNAIDFVLDTATVDLPESLTVEAVDKSHNEQATVLSLSASNDGASLEPNTPNFVQTEALMQKGIGMLPYGVLLIPASASAEEVTPVVTINGVKYEKADAKLSAGSNVGDSVTLNKVEAA